LAKIEKRVKTYDFQVLNEPRDDKLLLVLDVDYTLFGKFSFGVESSHAFLLSLMMLITICRHASTLAVFKGSVVPFYTLLNAFQIR